MIDMLEEDPRLVVLWAGYGFAKDYNQGRGHYYAIEDIHNSFRTGGPLAADQGPMPNTCWSCKSPDVPRLIEKNGIQEFYAGSWETKGHEVVNAIGCADCHDAETMNLRISRPALIACTTASFAFEAVLKTDCNLPIAPRSERTKPLNPHSFLRTSFNNQGLLLHGIPSN